MLLEALREITPVSLKTINIYVLTMLINLLVEIKGAFIRYQTDCHIACFSASSKCVVCQNNLYIICCDTAIKI